MLIVILLVPQRAGAVDGLPATLRSVSLLRLSARATSSAGAPTLSSFVNKVTRDKVELVATDENQAYNHVRRELPHQAVNHTQDEWVRGEVHANNIESFWTCLNGALSAGVTSYMLPSTFIRGPAEYNHST